MSLLHRIARLFKADMHGILDALEEPDVMLKQAVREMREEIEQSQTQLKNLSEQTERLVQKIAELSAALADYENQIDFYFAANDEAAVKNLLRKKLETARLLQALEQRRKTLLDEKAAGEAELAERQDKLQAILDKMALFAGRQADEELLFGAAHGDSVNCKAVTREDVDFAFLKEKQQRMQRQAQQENRP